MTDTWSLVRNGLRLFSRRGQAVFAIYGVSLMLIASLDAVALFFLARLVSFSDLDQFSLNSINASVASVLFVLLLFCLRSVLSTVITYVALRQGAFEEYLIGERALKTLMDPLTRLSSDGLGDFHNSVDRGPKELVLITFHAVTIPCEAFTALAIVGALVAYQPLTALIAFAYFASVAGLQQLLLSGRSTAVGEATTRSTDRVYQLLLDIRGLRRILGKASAEDFLLAARDARIQLTRARAMQTFVATLPRYFLEIVLALGLLVIGGTTYLVSGSPAALAATSLFVAAGFRLLPIVNRIQALSLSILAFAPTARLALARFPTVARPKNEVPSDPQLVGELENVSFTYPSAPFPALRSVSLRLVEGRQYAIVGASGAGKTTLVDLLLGLHVPQEGIVRWRQDIVTAYVPQDTHIAAASLASNVALSWNHASIDIGRVRSALRQVQLEEFIPLLMGSEALVGDQISGGQRQRLGLARAIFRNANFIVLDEVTSSLDVETERSIYEVIDSLRGSVTVVIVAHRLATIQRADTVFYLDHGQLLESGTFVELSEKLPRFRRQIELSQIRLEI